MEKDNYPIFKSLNKPEQLKLVSNIEYNIDEGNSLIGFTSALTEEQQTIIGENTSSKEIFQDIDNLKRMYRVGSDQKDNKELKDKIERRMHYWKDLLNVKFNYYFDPAGLGCLDC